MRARFVAFGGGFCADLSTAIRGGNGWRDNRTNAESKIDKGAHDVPERIKDAIGLIRIERRGVLTVQHGKIFGAISIAHAACWFCGAGRSERIAHSMNKILFVMCGCGRFWHMYSFVLVIFLFGELLVSGAQNAVWALSELICDVYHISV